jgi:hypothetical protein
MLLSGVLFVLFLAGCWLYCLTDAAVTPAEAFPGWRKRTWIVVIAVTLIAGAIAWMIARRNWRSHQWSSTGAANLIIIDRHGADVLWYPHPPTESAGPTDPAESAADAALSRHPAGRSRPDGRGRGRDRGLGRAGRTIPRGRGGYGGTGSPPVYRGPDDDPEFLRQLAQRIHGGPTDPAE